MNKDEIENISNRPEVIYNIPFYKNLPNLPVKIDLEGMAGDFLSYDIADLFGLQPIEKDHLDTYGDIITINPSKESLELYKKRDDSFQMIFLVINAYGFKEIDGVIHCKPYNISLFPASKRGELTSLKSDSIEKLDLEMDAKVPKFYYGFNPFKGAFGLYFYNHVDYSGIESDMIGFVNSMFLLSDKYNYHNVMPPIIKSIDNNAQIKADYKRYRKDRYFKKFKKIKPRKIWGCDSPIELFLLQAMDSLGLTPEIQTIITKDGLTIPSLHKLWENSRSRKRLNAITDADFYFPEKKLAVFCDSKEYHSSKESTNKDSSIDKSLAEIGIFSIRIFGKDIVADPIACALRVRDRLNEL
ncbi:hypothetical protein ACK3XA_25665 [Klebsiella grimontii]|uniref:hypothetical protein n=1 Tax=Klebsiella grimontii TaxID=2058152 RepID=UPI0039189DE7